MRSAQLSAGPLDAAVMADDWFEREQLHAAASVGDLELIRELLAVGHDPNAFDELGLTPLHYAARGEHGQAARLLLEAGADVNAHEEAKAGNTPLGDVAGNCSLAMARILLEAGADPSVPGWMQLTALDRASARKRGDGPAIYQLLLAARGRSRI